MPAKSCWCQAQKKVRDRPMTGAVIRQHDIMVCANLGLCVSDAHFEVPANVLKFDTVDFIR